MKTFLKIIVFIALAGSSKAQVPNFTITNNSGTYILTCNQTAIFFSAYTNVVGPVSFNWSGASFSITAPTATLTQAGNYTVTILDSLNNVFGTQYLTISSNTFAPASGVSPASQIITCTTTAGAGVTANASGNMTHYFISPVGATVVSNQSVATYTPMGPGSYTHVVIDNTNGCQSSSTFSLTSNQGYPTFNISSPQNFTLGCNSNSVTVININNASTAPVAGGPVSYTITSSLLIPAPPSGPLSNVNVYTITAPGLYYVIVKDNTNSCMTQIPLTILSNTAAPHISATVPTQVLNCNMPQVTLQGHSFSSNVSYQWTFIGIPGIVTGNVVTAISQPAAPTMTLVNTYTFSVTDNNSTCKSTTVIPIYQNLFPPTASISTGNNYTLSCTTPTIVLTNVSFSGIPPSTGFPITQPVVGYAWLAPATPSLGMSSQYVASAAGNHTLIAVDLNNGCSASTTAMIFGGCNTVGIQENQGQQDVIKLYPNPAQGQFVLVSERSDKNTSVEIYNAIGELIKKQNIQPGSNLISIHEQAPGIYHARIIQDDTLLQTFKIINE